MDGKESGDSFLFSPSQLNQVNLFIGAARGRDRPDTISAMLILYLTQTPGGVRDGFLPADHLPGLVDTVA